MARKLKQVAYRLDETRACIAGFVIREINGADELEAARMARTRQALTENEAIAHLMDEQARIAIVAVKELGAEEFVAVTQPFTDYNEWNSYTRALVLDAFQQLNDVSREDLAAFRAGAAEWGAPAPQPTQDEFAKPKRPATGPSTRSSSSAPP